MIKITILFDINLKLKKTFTGGKTPIIRMYGCLSKIDNYVYLKFVHVNSENVKHIFLLFNLLLADLRKIGNW